MAGRHGPSVAASLIAPERHMPIRSFLKSETASRLLDGRRVATYVVCRRYWGNNLKSVERMAKEHDAEPVDAIHFGNVFYAAELTPS